MAQNNKQQDSPELYQGKYRIKSARATWCNYNEGLYFITICTAAKKNYFGDIIELEMIFSEIGKYAQYCISQIERLHPNVIVPYSVVMPNHVHMIISITSDLPYIGDNVETPHCDVSTVDTKMREIANYCGKLSHLVSQFKSSVTKYAKKNEIPFGWQSRFHDHIIKNQDELQKISEYILNNVYKWNEDCYNDTIHDVETPHCDVSTEQYTV